MTTTQESFNTIAENTAYGLVTLGDMTIVENLLCGTPFLSPGQRYRTAGASSYKYQLLCWHGWLDNNRSFYHLAPSLIHHLQQGVDLVALDFPGHGKSSHKSLDGASTLLMDYVYYVHDAIHQLGWKSEQVIRQTELLHHLTYVDRKKRLMVR